MLLSINRYAWPVFRKECSALAVLALPMMLAQMAAVGVGLVDTAMAGAAGKDDLAAVALGSSAMSLVLITLIGVMTALNPMIAQLFGAGKTEAVGRLGRQGLWFGLMVGTAGMVLLLAAVRPLMWYLDLGGAVESMLAQYLVFAALGMPAAMLHRALHAYVSSLNKPKAVMWISWAALFLNIPLNYVFVYGRFGLPALGGAGCGLATMLVFWFNAAALWLYVKNNRYFVPFGLTGGLSRPDKAALKQIWRLGWPIGASYFLEVSLFSLIVFLVAKFGADSVAAQQIVISITSVVYMIPQALGAAATVRVGYAFGRGRRQQARYISGVAVVSGMVLAVCTMLFLMLAREPLAAAFTPDADVRALAASVLLLAALFQFFDFAQCIASYALRGYKITKAPMLVHAAAFWGMGLLPGYYFANGFQMGIFGFWTALILSLAAASGLLLWLLERHSGRVARERGLV
ncbi:MATE family efflux transporter [Neisseria leonii]|uniref:Multidrug-efflux transporter n=1 Tax=Neisseria leonii TaxID=2995413 RepID=A0A9X4IEV8_9NEIS|nr:MATE family efflux transporter [Neisseria sp. 51.81]MDD9328617.1 MATE family efflux transporter [Neisseria sp. 51.81]